MFVFVAGPGGVGGVACSVSHDGVTVARGTLYLARDGSST